LARILVISFSDLRSDPRVDRQVAALRTRHRVTAAALGPANYDDVEFIDITTAPLGISDAAAGLARIVLRRYETAYWKHPKYCEVLDRLRGVPADVVVANEMSPLPMALRLGVPVVLDAHEYAPEEFSDRPVWRIAVGPYARWLCQDNLPRVAAMMTVSEGIADRYEREFGVRATVVTNAPQYAELEPSPVGERVRILHHGLAQRGRGLDEMIRLVSRLDERFTLDLVLVDGDRGYRHELIRRIAGNPRVRVLPPVPMREIVPMANGYDVGLFLLPPNNFSRRFALPNKLFEFIQGRLAVAIGPSPEMAAVVRRYGCGVVSSDFRPETLAADLNRLDTSTIAALKQASNVAAAELCAERSQELILTVVEGALADESRSGRVSQAARRS
jgi:hypothetical protein